MSSESGWQDAVEPGWPYAAESCRGASLRCISICINPGCRRAPGLSAGRLIYRPAQQHSAVSDTASEGCRRLLMAGRLRVAQVHAEPRVTTRSPGS